MVKILNSEVLLQYLYLIVYYFFHILLTPYRLMDFMRLNMSSLPGSSILLPKGKKHSLGAFTKNCSASHSSAMLAIHKSGLQYHALLCMQKSDWFYGCTPRLRQLSGQGVDFSGKPWDIALHYSSSKLQILLQQCIALL